MNGVELVAASFPHFTPGQLAQLDKYVTLLLEVNTHLNLISRKETEHIWTRHILHSLSIAKVVGFAPGQHVVDVGTGGGLPGIPLAIVFPETQFLLVDSIGKKTRAVQEMITALGLANAKAKNARVEDIPQKFDFAVSRAVTRLPAVAGWLQGKIRKGAQAALGNGLIYIKGGDFQEEIDEVGKPYQVWEIGQWFSDPFFETKKVVWLDITR